MMFHYLITGPFILWLFAAATLVLSFLGTPIPSPYWWFSSATCALLGIWLNVRRPTAEQRRQQRKVECQAALKTIRHEVRNFNQIVDAQKKGQTLEGLRQKAVEVYSFELTSEALVTLRRYWRYRRLVDAALREIRHNSGCDLKDMKVEPLLNVLASLERRLVSEVS